MSSRIPAWWRRTRYRRYDLMCYGEVYLTLTGPLAVAQEVARNHVHTCPKGAMPWAEPITWRAAHDRSSRYWAAACGEWLNHGVEERP